MFMMEVFGLTIDSQKLAFGGARLRRVHGGFACPMVSGKFYPINVAEMLSIARRFFNGAFLTDKLFCLCEAIFTVAVVELVQRLTSGLTRVIWLLEYICRWPFVYYADRSYVSIAVLFIQLLMHEQKKTASYAAAFQRWR
jgi:hypothetical protein